jgi:PIN domain nuclease of toxin-antitoxin system
MERFVADTHALLWQLCAPGRLGSVARAAFANADSKKVEMHIPVVVVAEMSMVVQKKRIAGFDDSAFDIAIRSLQEHPSYHFGSLDLERVLMSRDLMGIPDIFDRLVVADGVALQATVITKDPVIQGSQYVPTIWD